MKLSTRTRYGLRAVVELALRGSGSPGAAPVPLSVVAKRQGISESYLRQILLKLKRAGLVDAVRGRSGGYLLAREPAKISALDVAKALGEDLGPVQCVTRPSACRRRRECPTYPLWCRLGDIFKEALSATTVAELADRCPGRGKQSMPRGNVFQI